MRNNEVLSQVVKRTDRTVHYFECIDSTNVRAKALAEAGAEHGTLVVAKQQTAGRGRRGRQWSSPPGKNLYFTVVLKPDFTPDKASMLTLVMAMAVARGIERCVMAKEESDAENAMDTEREAAACASNNVIGIKWPNDIVMNGKKICGILTEMGLEQNRIGHVLIGVGINVNRQDFAPELADKATSIEEEFGRAVSLQDLLESIMQAFEEHYAVFLQKCDLSGLREGYNAALVNRGRQVRVLDPKGEFGGIARGINDAGELLVELDDSKIINVYAGEVSVRGIYGYV